MNTTTRVPRRVTALSVALLALVLSAEAGDPPRLHLPFEGEGPAIADASGGEVGKHHPVSIRDQDDPASRDPDRYRVEGRYGQGLRYFAGDRSFTRVDGGLDFSGPIESLAVSLEVKLESGDANRFAALASTRADSDKAGFDLFVWGNQLRFRFSGGERVHTVETSAKSLRDGEWHTVEAAFHLGEAAIWIDGTRQVKETVGTARIVPPRRALFLGGYPVDNKGRRQYAFDGTLDEVAVGGLRNPLRSYLDAANQGRSNLPPPPPMRVSAQPIDGNERFFGGEKVFHSFRGHPVPLTFLFSSNPETLDPGNPPAFVLDVPEGMELVSVHQTNHNEPRGRITTRTSVIEDGGREWTRHRIVGIDLTKGERGGRGWKNGPFVSVGFRAPAGRDAMPIRYGLLRQGERLSFSEAEVRFLEPPEPVAEGDRGGFHHFGYFIMPSYAYPDGPLQKAMAELLESVGLTGKGRFYSPGGYWKRFDALLKKRGFTLYEIALWGGPNAYAMATDPEKTTREYVKGKAHHLRPNGMDEGVMFDHEPWRITYKKESFDEPIREAYARWAGLEATPSFLELRRQRSSRRWIEFWLWNTEQVYRAMSRAVREHHPDPDALRIAYTYFFPYDDEGRLWRRFRSIPKDPRRSEKHYDVHLISLYHTNDRELVEQTRLSRKHLEKPIWGISSVSRVNAIQSGFTNAEESLSPKRLEQKAVLCAALGMERHGLWPGRGWFDGRHLLALGEASRFIWQREAFYFDGDNVRDRVRVRPENGAKQDSWAATARRAKGAAEVTVFNFTDEPMRFEVDAAGLGAGARAVTVAPRGYAAERFDLPASPSEKTPKAGDVSGDAGRGPGSS